MLEGFCNPGRLSQMFLTYEQTFSHIACAYCYDGCIEYTDGRYNCNECKPGRWGPWCQYSCIPCHECINWPCKILCSERNDKTACVNSECPERCSVGFYGLRKSEKGMTFSNDL